ncbi:LacI family DNA-binding transcriptional regulator [Flavobacterium cellulosilyticum]|uniref:LacI family DNA-binding transcriptional regulator n=1 Tax=Flavobacterium cellulosilyticum TaxID=2541731 RepID=A0A4R5CB92_9FLAO|nr:LacI family DNA-binding transcriptional regulator [Flavobacterium cellulosilyticum]TDD95490.1 LacI family DNA-binding transcriptional regulator [Flavobacterium cellulosilyticum]
MAEIANVSVGTVDRIIHNRGQVTEENIAKVNAIIKEHGYKKNIFASNLAFNKKFIFAVFLPSNEGLEYWKAPVIGIIKAAQEFANFGVTIDYYYYDYNTTSFNTNANNILENEYDGLLFAPIFYEESVSFLTEYKKKNSPIVLIDSNIPEIDTITYIGQDSYQSGYLGGKLISFGMKEETNVLIIQITRFLESTSRTNVYLQRIKGFYSYFEEKKELPKFNFTEVSIKYDTENHLSTDMFNGIDCVFIPNSRVHVVAKFIKENELKGIRIVGYELLKQNLEYLNNGVIDFLIHQKPEEQGYLGINHLYKKVVLKEAIDELPIIPLEIIVRENYIPNKDK